MKINISVRALVEFLYRHGDIDSKGQAAGEEVMLAGSRLHRKIQSMMGAGYKAEYPLEYTFATARCEVTLEGRADGIIDTGECPNLSGERELTLFDLMTEDKPLPAIMIDEIKTVGRNVDHMTEPEPVHLAQAMCYAAIYLMQEDLAEIGVRMTYVTRDTERIRYFDSSYTAEEIKGWFKDTCDAIGVWVDMQDEWNGKRQESIEGLEFPFPYRPGQQELAGHVYRTIYHGKKLFIEAPTGTGKTLSVLYPAIKSMGEGRGSRIFYLTARTIARTVAENAVDILKGAGLSLKNITLTAKEKICFMDETECDPELCPYAKGHFDRINACLFDIVTHEETYPREVIEEYARRHEVCPFELSLDISLFADCIICDYNYVFDPNAYLRRFFGMGTGGDYLFLVDEAHNLVDRGREMYSAVLIKEDLLACKRACAQYQPQIARSIEKCNKAMLALKRGRGSLPDKELQVMSPPDELIRNLVRLYDVMGAYLADHNEGIGHSEILDLYFKVSEFLSIWDLVCEDYCIYNGFTSDGDFYVKLFCVDPAGNLRENMARARSTVLFSATLLPIQYYKKMLGGTAEDYEVYAKSVFDNANRLLVQAVDVSSRYVSRSRSQYLRMAGYIHRITRARCGNYMVYAPSYAYMEQVYDIYMSEYGTESGAEVICQSHSMREADREAFLLKFKESGARTLIGFCVLGGIFAEGIDLRDNELIGVIIMGTGLPQIGGERDLLKDHFDRAGMNGFDYAYSYPGMNRVQQAAGRLIRTETDRGVVALLDERFSMASNRRMFPREWDNVRCVDIDTVEDAVNGFWSGMGEV